MFKTLLSCLEQELSHVVREGCGLLRDGQVVHPHPLAPEHLILTALDVVRVGLHTTYKVEVGDVEIVSESVLLTESKNRLELYSVEGEI